MGVKAVIAAGIVASAFEILETMSEKERGEFLQSQEKNLQDAFFYTDETYGFAIGLSGNVTKGDCVASLPLGQVITGLEKYSLSPFLKDFSEFEMMAIRVIYERLSPRVSSNFKREYIHFLPTDYLHLPLFWADSDFELLESHTLDIYEREYLRGPSIDDFHKRLQAALSDVQNLPSGMLSREAAEYGLAVALTHSFGSGSEAMKKAMGYAPTDSFYMIVAVLDIANHFPLPAAVRKFAYPRFHITPELKICSLAQRNQLAGEQYMGNYGNYPNYRLLTTYAFALERNPDDELHFFMPISDFCQGHERGEYCVYSTPAHLISMDMMKYLLHLLADMKVIVKTTPEDLIEELGLRSDNENEKKLITLVLQMYRHHMLSQIARTPLRTLRHSQSTCSDYRCRIIHTFCIAQRLSRLLHVRQVERFLLKIVSAGIL